MAAACVAAAEGASVLLLEQSDRVGGTTAISGGMVWIPANHKSAACGRDDSLQAARDYLAGTVPGGVNERLEAFIEHGDEAIRYLESHTEVRLKPVVTYPDYYPELPGATLGGRVLEPETFDGSALGAADFGLLRDPLPEFTLFGGMMISRQDIPHLRRAARSARSAVHVSRLLARYASQRLRGAHRGTTLYLGNALSARLFRSVRKLGVTLATGWSVEQLATDGGRVTGLTARHVNGESIGLEARRAVILATGGISHGDLRQAFVPASAGTLSATVDPGRAPRGASLAKDVGARMAAPTEEGALWVPASTFKRSDGSHGVFPHTVTDRAKPGLIAVDGQGRRFCNEAVSYHEFVRAQLRAGPSAIPAWLVCDRQFLWKYGLGRVRPFALSVEADVQDGYLRRADSIEALAARIGVPPTALATTVATFNDGAAGGIDEAFGRGGNAYQRHLGDGDHQPNPCVAAIVRAPFFAVAVVPADLGMAAGLVTDANARVLYRSGQPIPGLYACGNDMHSVMEGAYPGPGITLGPALTFGYLAARDALRQA